MFDGWWRFKCFKFLILVIFVAIYMFDLFILLYLVLFYLFYQFYFTYFWYINKLFIYIVFCFISHSKLFFQYNLLLHYQDTSILHENYTNDSNSFSPMLPSQCKYYIFDILCFIIFIHLIHSIIQLYASIFSITTFQYFSSIYSFINSFTATATEADGLVDKADWCTNNMWTGYCYHSSTQETCAATCASKRNDAKPSQFYF